MYEEAGNNHGKEIRPPIIGGEIHRVSKNQYLLLDISKYLLVACLQCSQVFNIG